MHANSRLNAWNQPVGLDVADWQPRPLPPATPMAGRYCQLEPLQIERDAPALFDAYQDETDNRNWTYLALDRPPDFATYHAWLTRLASGSDPFFQVIRDLQTGQPVGVSAFMRIDRSNGVLELGHLNFSPRLQRTRMATEAIYLMLRRAFDELGYRRAEWKCDSLNQPSRIAAERFGFRFEGIFRQAVVVKGRNRDHAWYSIIDREWPALRLAFEQWLEPGNFDAAGRQLKRLQEFLPPPA